MKTSVLILLKLLFGNNCFEYNSLLEYSSTELVLKYQKWFKIVQEELWSKSIIYLIVGPNFKLSALLMFWWIQF